MKWDNKPPATFDFAKAIEEQECRLARQNTDAQTTLLRLMMQAAAGAGHKRQLKMFVKEMTCKKPKPS